MVGRNLMFHAGDFLAICPTKSVDRRGPKKTLALNDFYFAEGRKLGTFQTIGADLEVGHIIQYLRNTSESREAWWRWLFAPNPVWWSRHARGRRLILLLAATARCGPMGIDHRGPALFTESRLAGP
jgi:hypothetical protein